MEQCGRENQKGWQKLMIQSRQHEIGIRLSPKQGEMLGKDELQCEGENDEETQALGRSRKESRASCKIPNLGGPNLARF